MSKEITFKGLRKFNIIMGGIHLLQGILMIVLGLSIEKLGNFKLDIYQYYLYFNQDLNNGHGGLELNTDTVLFTLPFYVLVASFLLISALAHALISLPKGVNETYNSDLERGINKLRWFEYALSSSVMIVLIAYLFGIYDIASLILIFIVNASMNLFGLVMEQLNSGKDKVNWGPFIWGTIAGLAPWIAILLYMTGASSEVTAETPWFVWAIVISYFVAFNTFPINMVMQYLKKGKWKNYLYGERGYIVLSLVAKTILAWLVFAGAMQP